MKKMPPSMANIFFKRKGLQHSCHKKDNFILEHDPVKFLKKSRIMNKRRIIVPKAQSTHPHLCNNFSIKTDFSLEIFFKLYPFR